MDGWRLIVQIMDNLKDIQNMTSKLLFFDLETTGVKFWRNGIHQNRRDRGYRRAGGREV